MHGAHLKTMHHNKIYLVNYFDMTVIRFLCPRVKVVPSKKRETRELLIIIINCKISLYVTFRLMLS